jgi:N-ethylmaleimide reductase
VTEQTASPETGTPKLYTPFKLGAYGIAYLHVIELRIKGDVSLHEGRAPVASKYLQPFFPGPIIAAGGFDREGAEAIVEAGTADLVAVRRHFTSNPDLPYRLKHKLPLTPYVPAAFWGGDEDGYTDFPVLEPADACVGPVSRFGPKSPSQHEENYHDA